MPFQHIIHPALDLAFLHGPEPLARFLEAAVIDPDGMIPTDED